MHGPMRHDPMSALMILRRICGSQIVVLPWDRLGVFHLPVIDSNN
jgi:hypothetical protein